MTIKDFARLCGCNPKTLRYYDQIELLKPVRVDKFSGYRHYDEKQALTFVKIKNLQSAGFSIGEIKKLLDKDDSVICAAFDRKIAEQEARLEKIRDIQRSYHTEMKKMDTKLTEIRDQVRKAMTDYDPTGEFGLATDNYDMLISNVLNYFDALYERGGNAEMDFSYNDDDPAPQDDEYQDIRDFFDDPEYELVYENNGWQNISQCLPEVKNHTASDDECVVSVQLVKDKVGSLSEGLAIACTMLGVAIGESADAKRNISTNVTVSEDGVNHLRIFRRTTTE